MGKIPAGVRRDCAPAKLHAGGPDSVGPNLTMPAERLRFVMIPSPGTKKIEALCP